MTQPLQSRRTSLAPIAAALSAATVEYAESRTAFEEISQELQAARRRNSPERVELADQSDAAVEAMGSSQERVANLSYNNCPVTATSWGEFSKLANPVCNFAKNGEHCFQPYNLRNFAKICRVSYRSCANFLRPCDAGLPRSLAPEPRLRITRLRSKRVGGR